MAETTGRLRARVTVAVLAGAVASSATAYEKGDWLLRMGWAEVAPNETSGTLQADGGDAGLGDDVVAVSNGTALGFSMTYMFNPYIGLELLAATPFEHDISASGQLAPLVYDALGTTRIGSTLQLPPTLTVQYYPVAHSNPANRWQPYLGQGVNYTWFYDEQLDAGFADPQGLSDKDFHLSDSLGLVALVGIDYVIADNWIVNTSIMYAQIATEAKIANTVLGDLVVDVDIDPWVYRLNFGYRF